MKKRVLLSGLVLSFFLIGCTPSYIDKNYEKEIENKGAKLIKDYLNSEGIDDELVSLGMVKGTSSGAVGNFASYVVEAELRDGDTSHFVYADTDSGMIYTDYNMGEIGIELARRVDSAIENAGLEGEFPDRYYISDFDTCIQIVSEGVETTKKDNPECDVLVELREVIPVDITQQNAAEYIDKLESDGGTFSFSIYYDKNFVMPSECMLAICEANPSVNTVSGYGVSEYSLNYVAEHGIIDSAYQMELGEECYAHDSENFRKSKHDILSSDGMSLNYVCATEYNGDVQNYSLSVILTNDSVYIPKSASGTVVFFTSKPDFSGAREDFSDGSHLDYEIKEFDNGYYSFEGTKSGSLNRGVYIAYSDTTLTFVK